MTVPAETTRDLRAIPTTRGDRRVHRIGVVRPGLATGWQELRYLCNRHRAFRADPSMHPVPGFPRYLCDILGADRLIQLAGYTVRETWRRLRRSQAVGTGSSTSPLRPG